MSSSPQYHGVRRWRPAFFPELRLLPPHERHKPTHFAQPRQCWWPCGSMRRLREQLSHPSVNKFGGGVLCSRPGPIALRKSDTRVSMFTRALQSTGSMVPVVKIDQKDIANIHGACGRGSLWIRSALRQRGDIVSGHHTVKTALATSTRRSTSPGCGRPGPPAVCQRRRSRTIIEEQPGNAHWQKKTVGERGDVVSGPIRFENRTASSRFGGAQSARRLSYRSRLGYVDGPELIGSRKSIHY